MHFLMKKRFLIVANIAAMVFSFIGNASFLVPAYINPVRIVQSKYFIREKKKEIEVKTKISNNEKSNLEASVEKVIQENKNKMEQMVGLKRDHSESTKIIQNQLQNQWVWKETKEGKIQVYLDRNGLISPNASEWMEEHSQILLQINRKTNRIYVYEMDHSGEYTRAIRVMLCSTGKSYSPTKKGEYGLKRVARWHRLNGNVYGQYCSRISNHYLIHSVFYSQNMNPKTLNIREYRKLGQNASHGCVRLLVADAKWIYERSERIHVVISDESGYFPLEEPVLADPIVVNGNRGIDPTDREALSGY